jgi:hypothetical protein
MLIVHMSPHHRASVARPLPSQICTIDELVDGKLGDDGSSSQQNVLSPN